MNIDHLYITYSHDYDKEINVISGHGEISLLQDGEVDEPEIIGATWFTYYNVYDFDEPDAVVFSAETISDDEEYMLSTLIYDNFPFENGGKLITLDRIEIADDYYSVELEQKVLEDLLEYCVYMDFDYIAVIASKPLDKIIEAGNVIEFPQTKQYEKYGFTVFGGIERKHPIMIKDLGT